MRCPFCDNSDSDVVDSRSYDNGDGVRRRRKCRECGEKFTTYEKIEEETTSNKRKGKMENKEPKKKSPSRNIYEDLKRDRDYIDDYSEPHVGV